MRKIKEKYPRAWDKLVKWYGWDKFDMEMLDNGTLYFEQLYDGGKSIATTTLSFGDIVKGRRLYDFFDEYGVYIDIDPVPANTVTFEYHVFSDDDLHSIWEYKSRTEAEERAFLKAFEILENKL